MSYEHNCVSVLKGVLVYIYFLYKTIAIVIINVTVAIAPITINAICHACNPRRKIVRYYRHYQIVYEDQVLLILNLIDAY